jgi:hypothetical protein
MIEVVRDTEQRLVDAIPEDLPLGEGAGRMIKAQSQAICEGLRFLARRIEALEACSVPPSISPERPVKLPPG